MAYIARRRLNLGTRVAEPGDPVPEAASWRNLDAYISSGQVEFVPDSLVEDKPKAKPKAAADEAVEAGEGASGDESPSRPRRSSPPRKTTPKPKATKPKAK